MTLNRTLLIALAVWLGGTQAAWAQPACGELKNTLFLQVGDTQEPLMKNLGRKLRDSKANPITLVYFTSGSCSNIDALYKGTPITMNAKYVPSTEEDANWKTADAALACTIAKDPGQPIDVANSALFVSACTDSAPPDGIKLFQGPNQGYAFVVPKDSGQHGITAEEAFSAFGFGADGGAEPWTDPEFFFIRTPTKSTLLALAANIKVPGAKWKGKGLDKSSEVLTAVKESTSREKTIGILGTEIFDANRSSLDILAFQAFGQKHGYFPDSTAGATDKRNVRDGHYTPWSPTVWITHVDGDGKPTNARADYVIKQILGLESDPKPDFEPLDAVIEVGLVPECAMSVTREKEGGDLSLYSPEEPCGCYFDRKKAGGTSCDACDSDKACSKGTCRHGYCEAR